MAVLRQASLRHLLKSGSSIESDHYDPEKEVKICVLYTGGTIGMKSQGGVYSPAPNFLRPELKTLPMFHDPGYVVSYAGKEEDIPLVMPESKEGKRIMYSVYEYVPLIDSSNMSMDDYIRIAKDIKKYYDMFEGFVILHGTDTMAYTASALSFMLEYLGKPVILTGAQIPIFETRSDGRDNFLGALIMAGHYAVPEVTIYFHNMLLRGNRSTKVDNSSMNAFMSPNMHPLADLGINIKVHWKAIYRPARNQAFQIQDDMCVNVGLLRFFPSITAQTVSGFLQPPMQGVVLQSYGAGNGPDARADILKVFKDATDRGVIIMNITQCSKGKVSALYAAGKALADAGVLPGADMTPEAALLKLSYVLAKNEWDLERKRELMQRNLRGELTATETDIEEVHLSIIDKLAKTLKIASDEEVELLQESLFPSLVGSAARKGDIERLQMLTDAGADIKIGDYDGRRALHIAVCEGHIDTVKFLIQRGALIHAKDRFGHMAIDDAVRFGHLDIIDILVQNGARLYLTSSKIFALICNTIIHEDKQQLEAWYRARANINQTDSYGKTPLHVACTLGKIERVQDLLKFGANLNATDANSKLPLDDAKENGQSHVVEFLDNYVKCNTTN